MGTASRRRFAVEAALVVASCLVLEALFAARTGSRHFRLEVSDYALAAMPLLAGAVTVRRGFRERQPARSVWVLLGLAAISWGLGQCCWAWYEAVRGVNVPFPSLADAGYLTTVPLLAAGLLRLPVGTRTLASTMRALIDGALIAGSVFLISWVLVLHTVAAAGSGSLLSQSIGLAYPIGDVIVVTIVFFTILRSRASGLRPLVPIGLIALALCAFAFSDSAFDYLTQINKYASGDPIDGGWFTGWALLLIASRRPYAVSQDESDERKPAGLLVPYAAVVAAFLVSSIEVATTHRSDSVVSWSRTIIVLLIVCRQLLLMRENMHLTRHLENRVMERTAELADSQRRFEALVRHSSDVVTVVDSDSTVRYQSESLHRVFGHDTTAALGRRFSEYVDPDSVPDFVTALRDAAREPFRTIVRELPMRHADGRVCHAELTVTNLLHEPSVAGLVLNTRDISERKLLQEQLVHEAFHDALTSLANRALFEDRVNQALLRSNGSSPTAVLFLDLDGFKEINDSLGHAVGDLLLSQVAERLRECIRTGDTVARFGGDEFAVLLEQSGDQVSAVAAAQRVRAALEQPFGVEGRELHVRASIGIAVVQTGDVDAGQLLRNADLAMYRAKAMHSGGYVVYDPSMHADLLNRLDLEADLRRAIRDGGLFLVYQPTVSVATGQITGVEALVRWQHPERGVLLPTEFIPLAEETGLIYPLGEWVLREACRQAKQWQDEQEQEPLLSINVNISGRQVEHAEFPGLVREVLAETELEPSSLILEITESVLMDDSDRNQERLTELKDMGIRLAIDDFGTGYSSLRYLHRFPVDLLKIDRSFIQPLGTGSAGEEFVQTILRLGETLHVATVAEGIEDHRQLLALRRLGCPQAQGYYLGRPTDASSIASMLSEQAQQAPAV